jgi:hypothetical protein
MKTVPGGETPAFLRPLINFSKNVVIVRSFLFIAGTPNQHGSLGAHHNG